MTISVRFLGNCFLPLCTLPAGAVSVSAPIGVALALDAGVHVRFVVVADVQQVVAALQDPRKRLQTDVVGTSIATKSDELHLFVHSPLPFQGTVRGLHAAHGGRHVLEGIVNEGHFPGRLREDGRHHLRAAGGTATYHMPLCRTEHLVEGDDRHTACTRPMSWR